MEKKMNICFIVSEICNKGPVNVVLNLAKEYIKKHFEVTVIALRPSATEYEKHFIKYGIKIIYLYNKKTFNLFKLAKKLKMVLNSKCYDILHSHGFIADALVATSKVKVKKITTIHCVFREDYLKEHGFFIGFSLSLSHNLLLNLFLFNKIVCCSHSVEVAVKKNIFFKNTENIFAIQNGVDQTKYYPLNEKDKSRIRKELDFYPNNKIYIFSGRIIRRKRVPELVEIFLNNTDENSILVICGDGDELDSCKEIALNNRKIIFKGFINDITQYYQASDYIISNSSSEGFPMSIIEGISCGCYAYLSGIPSHEELIKTCPLLADKLENIKKVNKICISQLSTLSSIKMADLYLQTYTGKR